MGVGNKLNYTYSKSALKGDSFDMYIGKIYFGGIIKKTKEVSLLK